MRLLRTIRHRVRRGHRREEGQAAFEFLLMLPVFILFLLMAIDFGVLMYQYVSVANAAREGARLASVNCGGTCDETTVQTRVIERSGGVLEAGDIGDVTVAWIDGPDAGSTTGDRGDAVAVRVSHSHTLIFFPHTFQVVSCSDMRLEQRDGGAGALPGGSGCN